MYANTHVTRELDASLISRLFDNIANGIGETVQSVARKKPGIDNAIANESFYAKGKRGDGGIERKTRFIFSK